MDKKDFGEVKTSEQINVLLDIIKDIFNTKSQEDWNKLYKPIQVMKKQRLKLINPEKYEKELDKCED